MGRSKGADIEFSCYMVVAETIEFDGVEFQRGQLVFEELAGKNFRKAKERGDVVAIDPLGDLNVQLAQAR